MPISTLLALAATLAPSAGEPGITEGEVLGRSQGGVSAKVHLRAEEHGKPITVVLTSGAWRQSVALEALLNTRHNPPSRSGPSAPATARDGGRQGVQQPSGTWASAPRGIRSLILSRSNERHLSHFDRAAYRLRSQIDRPEQFCRITTRYEKRTVNGVTISPSGKITLWP